MHIQNIYSTRIAKVIETITIPESAPISHVYDVVLKSTPTIQGGRIILRTRQRNFAIAYARKFSKGFEQ